MPLANENVDMTSTWMTRENSKLCFSLAVKGNIAGGTLVPSTSKIFSIETKRYDPDTERADQVILETWKGRSRQVTLPELTGEDTIAIFIDEDGNPETGYYISEMTTPGGAERMIEIKGKDGDIKKSRDLVFTGEDNSDWSWEAVRDVEIGKDAHRIELQVPQIMGQNSEMGVYILAHDWNKASEDRMNPQDDKEMQTGSETRSHACVRYIGNGPSGYTRGLWHLNEGNGTAVNDSSGQSPANHGTLNPNGGNWEAGRYGSCYNFTGIDELVSVSDASSLNVTGELTLEAWIKPDDVNGLQYVISKWYAVTNQRSYALCIENGKVDFRFTPDGTWGSRVQVISTQTISTNVWTHIAGTYDGSTMKIFINGVQDISMTATSLSVHSGSASVTIGGRLNNDYFDGCIDEARILNISKTVFNPGVVINEVCYDPVSGYEWIELYNGGPVTVNCTGWQFRDAQGNEYCVPDGEKYEMSSGEFVTIWLDDQYAPRDTQSDWYTTNTSTWQHIGDAGGIDIRSLTSDGNGTLFAVGEDGDTYRSVDMGFTWESRGNINVDKLRGIVCTGNGTLVTVTRDGEVNGSFDNGTTWSAIGNIGDENIRSMTMVPNGTLLSVTKSGHVYLSSDNGSTWGNIGNLPNTDIRSITSLDNGTLFCAAEDGSIFRSVTNGTTWSDVGDINLNRIRSIASFNNGTLIVIRDKGGLFRSIDQGMSWEEIEGINDIEIRDMITLYDDRIITCTKQGEIYQSITIGNSLLLYNSNLDGDNTAQTGGDMIALFAPGSSPSSSTILDFVAWGTTSGSYENMAYDAGLWVLGDRVSMSGLQQGDSIGLFIDGNNEEGLVDWVGFTVTSQGSTNENGTVVPEFSEVFILCSVFLLMGFFILKRRTKKRCEKKWEVAH